MTVNVEKKVGQGEIKIKEEDEDVDDESMQLEQKEVAKLCSLKYFGESALLIDETDTFRNATVVVSSEKCDLLHLTKVGFIKLIEANKDTFDDTRKEIKAVYMERRKSLLLSLDGSAVNESEVDESEVDESIVDESVVNRNVAIYPKGIPIHLEGSKKKNVRSLFL